MSTFVLSSRLSYAIGVELNQTMNKSTLKMPIACMMRYQLKPLMFRYSMTNDWMIARHDTITAFCALNSAVP